MFLQRVVWSWALAALGMAAVFSPEAIASRRDSSLPEGTLVVSMCELKQEQGLCVEGSPTPLNMAVFVPREIFAWDGTTDPYQVSDNRVAELGPLAWSPDATSFAVTGDSDDDEETCRLYLVSPSDGATRAITPDSEFACPWDPDWSPDGRWIVMSVLLHDGPTDLYKVRPNGSRLKRLTTLPQEGVDAWSPQWIDGGARILFTGNPIFKKNGVYIIEADGTNMRPLVEFPLRGPDRRIVWETAVSPDRRRVAYASFSRGERSADPDEVFVIGTNGSDHRRVTFNSTREMTLSWAPDNRRLAIVEGDPYSGEPTRITVLDTRSGSRRVIPSPETGYIGVASAPVWSPSGRYLAFHVVEGDRRPIYIARASGSEPTRVTELEGNVWLRGWR